MWRALITHNIEHNNTYNTIEHQPTYCTTNFIKQNETGHKDRKPKFRVKNNNKVRVYYFPKGLNLALPTAVDLLLPRLHFHSKAEIYQSLKKTYFFMKGTGLC